MFQWRVIILNPFNALLHICLVWWFKGDNFQFLGLRHAWNLQKRTLFTIIFMIVWSIFLFEYFWIFDCMWVLIYDGILYIMLLRMVMWRQKHNGRHFLIWYLNSIWITAIKFKNVITYEISVDFFPKCKYQFMYNFRQYLLVRSWLNSVLKNIGGPVFMQLCVPEFLKSMSC